MNEEFKTHKLTEEGIGKAKKIAEIFDGLLNDLKEMDLNKSNPRCFSIMKTKMEEACFFAKKALATNSNLNVGENK